MGIKNIIGELRVNDEKVVTEGELDKKLGTIDEALDAIIAIQEELIGITLITFTISGTEYQAEDGMTWGEWVGSKYDTKPHIIEYEYIRDNNGMSVYLNDYSKPVYQYQTITNGYAYIYD